MSSPWRKIEKPEPVCLTEIMSEELAKDLQYKENSRNLQSGIAVSPISDSRMPASSSLSSIEDIPEEVLRAISNDLVDSDAIIAQMLQAELDKEYNEMLSKEERKLNGSSKVAISFENYKRMSQPDFDSESEEEEIVDIRDRKDWDRFDTLQRHLNSIPGCGYRMQENGEMVTKHDLVNSGRKNACKLLSFPPEFQTGDGEPFDLKLSNKVYNSLKNHSNKEQTRKAKTLDKREDRSTAEFGMDQNTSLIVYKLINAGLIQSIKGIISTGKESVVLQVNVNPETADLEELPPEECVLKIFKTTLAQYKRRCDYIRDDQRYKHRIGKQTSKKTIGIWAEKERDNLIRLDKAGIKCPKVVALKGHILVISFIGQDNIPAPKLKDALMSDAEYILAYEEVIENMKKLYHRANLIHADLSEYNILWFENSCYFIDVGQAVEPTHLNAWTFLYRDCCNVINFFEKKGVPKLLTSAELFREIVGCDYEDKLSLIAVQESFKIKPHLVDKPGMEPSFEFNSVWEKHEQGEMPQSNLKVSRDVDEII